MAVPEDHRIQNVAMFLIVAAAAFMSLGEWKSWVHLIDFAQVFGGGGVGILTGQKIQSTLTNKEGGTMNISAPPVDQPPA